MIRNRSSRIMSPSTPAGKTAGFINQNQRIEIMEKEKRESCFPRPPFKKKHLAETLTIGFLAGVAATIGMFRLIKK